MRSLIAFTLPASLSLLSCAGAPLPPAEAAPAEPPAAEPESPAPVAAPSESTPDEPEATEPAADEPATETPLDRYPLVVVFFSPGNGTDVEAMRRLTAVIAATRPVPRHDTARWGKEGEHNECFAPGELSKEAFSAFVKKARAAVESSDRVKVSSDAPCSGP